MRSHSDYVWGGKRKKGLLTAECLDGLVQHLLQKEFCQDIPLVQLALVDGRSGLANGADEDLSHGLKAVKETKERGRQRKKSVSHSLDSPSKGAYSCH